MTAIERLQEIVGSARGYIPETKLASLAVLMPGQDIETEAKLVEQKLAKVLIAKNVLFDLVERDLMGACPPWLLTREALIKHNPSGNTPLHLLAEKGQLGRLPEGLVTQEMLFVRDKLGGTPLHDAAKGGHLDAVPISFWSNELLSTKTNKKNKGGELTLGYMCVNAGFVDKIAHLLSPQLLVTPNKDGNTILHLLAYRGELHKLPAGLVTAEMMNVRDTYNGTPLHDAAASGNLHAVPAHLISERALGAVLTHNNPIPAIGAENCASIAIQKGGLADIVPYLTEDLLISHANMPFLKPNPTSAILYAAKAGLLGEIPAHLLTAKVLTHKSLSKWLKAGPNLPDKCSALDVAARFGGLEHIPNLEKYLLLKDDLGRTILAQAVANNQAAVVKPFVTPELLQSRSSACSDRWKWTDASLLGIASTNGNLASLVDITSEILFATTTEGKTTSILLDNLISTGEIHKLPVEVFTLPVLIYKGKDDLLVADILAKEKPRGMEVPDSLKHLFSDEWLEANETMKDLVTQMPESEEIGMF